MLGNGFAAIRAHASGEELEKRARVQEVGAAGGGGRLGLGVEAPLLGLPGLVDAGELPGLGGVERAAATARPRTSEPESATSSCRRDEREGVARPPPRRGGRRGWRRAARRCMTPVDGDQRRAEGPADQASQGSQAAAWRAASASGAAAR